MGNILEEFWYGNINPQEQSKESSRAIKDLLKLMGRNRDRLHDSMTAEQRETLEKYDDCVNEMYGLIELEIFSYAFRPHSRFFPLVWSLLVVPSERKSVKNHFCANP